MILHYLQFDLAKNIWFSVFFEHDGHSPFQMAWIQVCVYPICLKLRVIIQFHLVNYFLKKLPYQGNDNIRTLWLAKSRKHDPSILRKHPVHMQFTKHAVWSLFKICSKHLFPGRQKTENRDKNLLEIWFSQFRASLFWNLGIVKKNCLKHCNICNFLHCAAHAACMTFKWNPKTTFKSWTMYLP